MLGILCVAAAATIVARRANTLFFGFAWLAFFHVTSATLSGFAHGTLFGAPLDWYTRLHAEVIHYSIWGALAMLLGMSLGWRSWSAHRQIPLSPPQWASVPFGLLLFLIGIVATAALVFLARVPTIGTGLESLTRLRELALIVLLVDAMQRRSWSVVAVCGLFYVPISIAGALASGHTPAKVDLLIPVACVVAGWRQVGMKTLIVLGIAALSFYLLFAGWMSSRVRIRTGELVELSFTDAASEFAGDMVENAAAASFEPNSVNERIRERLDMTDILAFQRNHQPEVEPFARGATFLEAGMAMIPRAVWPGKPVVAGGSLFVERFTGIQRSADDQTSVGLPYPFELYANWGIPGVIIGLFIVGYLVARLELYLMTGTLSLGRRLFWASVLLTLSAGGQRMDVVLPSIVAGALTAGAVGFGLARFVAERESLAEHPDPATVRVPQRG